MAEIILHGPFTDQDVEEIMAMMRRIDERNPTATFRTLILNPDATLEEAHRQMKEALPASPERATFIEAIRNRPAGYWMNETTGVLRPAIMAYLNGETMTGKQIAAMRAYLRQWIEAPQAWQGEHIDKLRVLVNTLTTRSAITAWLDLAMLNDIDPL
jgi:hypothetical protein